jgi:hypothetical protein
MPKRTFATNTMAALIQRYRSIRKRLSDSLKRGSNDYSEVTALSQETGKLRQQTRDYFRRKRKLHS